MSNIIEDLTNFQPVLEFGDKEYLIVPNNTRYNKYRLIDGTRFIAISTSDAIRYSKKVGVELDMEDAHRRYTSE